MLQSTPYRCTACGALNIGRGKQSCRYVCAYCSHREREVPRPPANQKNKLNRVAVRCIRASLDTQDNLAARYGVTSSNISLVLTYGTWRSVKPPALIEDGKLRVYVLYHGGKRATALAHGPSEARAQALSAGVFDTRHAWEIDAYAALIRPSPVETGYGKPTI